MSVFIWFHNKKKTKTIITSVAGTFHRSFINTVQKLKTVNKREYCLKSRSNKQQSYEHSSDWHSPLFRLLPVDTPTGWHSCLYTTISPYWHSSVLTLLHADTPSCWHSSQLTLLPIDTPSYWHSSQLTLLPIDTYPYGNSYPIHINTYLLTVLPTE